MFAIFMSFYFCALWCLKEQAIQLTQLLVLIIAQQCVYAVAYYTLGLRQFHSPGFGPRAVGTFDNPSHLYPLCLVGIPISLILAEMEVARSWRWFWRGITTMMLLVLTLTYTRAGWVACGVSLGYLALSTYSLFSRRKNTRRVLIGLALILLTGAIFVRTKGRVAGNPDDRSFWGRITIWGTAVQIIADHPLLGNGLNTYPQKQKEHMTKRLEHFNPMNQEAKNLYLNLTAELGLVGLTLFCLVTLRYYQLYRFIICTFPPSSEIYKIAIGIHAALIGIAVAGLVDTPILHHARAATTFSIACLLGILCSLVKHAFPTPTPDAATLQKRRQRFWRGVGIVTAILILPLAYLLWHITIGVKEALAAFPKVHELANRSLKSSSLVRLKEIAPVMRDAVVASEDGYFYFHHGVDWLALHRALRHNIRAIRIKQGGSTITMQLARYLFLSRERTLSRKVAEILVALEMEKVLSKERILELYLNKARFGMGEGGILSASRNYFGKHPKDLTLAEAAFLAGVLPEPPFEHKRVTPSLVWRCQQRAFKRLQSFFPTQYPKEAIEMAQKIPLRFAWGMVVKPLPGGVNK